MNKIIQSVCGLHDLKYRSLTPVSGGDINSAYAVDTTEGKLFIKLNSASDYPGMFKKEAEGLNALHKATTLKIPTVIAYGEIQDQQYLILEWLEKSSPSSNFWQQFAEGLVQLHKTTHTHFGFLSSNYIGSLVQENKQTGTWAEFYETQRIMPLTQKLFDERSFHKEDVQNAERLCSKLGYIFPSEPPSLLHGDLWGGNYMAVRNSTSDVLPSIYDPAVYYGHREMDIGMTLLFGGFNNRLYETYLSLFPLESDWRKRVSLTQLYPLLVHAILFGDTYVSQCRNIIKLWN